MSSPGRPAFAVVLPQTCVCGQLSDWSDLSDRSANSTANSTANDS